MTTERWDDERLDRLAAEIAAQNLANARDIAHLVEASEKTRQDLDRLTGITDRLIGVVQSNAAAIAANSEGMRELRAGQEQQSRILDYLLRKEQERQQRDDDR